MKLHSLLPVFLLSLTGPLLKPAFSQAPAQPPLISVSGSAEVKVVPNEIYLRVGVETRHENLQEAKVRNDAGISKALAFLQSAGVEDKHVQTDFTGIEPAYDDNVSRTKPAIWTVRKSIEVKLIKTEGFEEVLTGLLAGGVTNVHGIEFRTSELRKHRDAARAMAVRAAREKADALALELGVKRGGVYSIRADEGGGWFNASGGYWGRSGAMMSQNVVQDAGGASAGDGAALSLGQISVSATVSVSFLIE